MSRPLTTRRARQLAKMRKTHRARHWPPRRLAQRPTLPLRCDDADARGQAAPRMPACTVMPAANGAAGQSCGASRASRPWPVAATAGGRMGDAIGDEAVQAQARHPPRGRPQLDPMATPERLALETCLSRRQRATRRRPCPFHAAPPAIPPLDAAHRERPGAGLGASRNLTPGVRFRHQRPVIRRRGRPAGGWATRWTMRRLSETGPSCAARHRGRCASRRSSSAPSRPAEAGVRGGRCVRVRSQGAKNGHTPGARIEPGELPAPWRRPVTARARTVTIARQVNGTLDSSSRRTYPVPVWSGRVQTSESARLKFPPRISSMLWLE